MGTCGPEAKTKGLRSDSFRDSMSHELVFTTRMQKTCVWSIIEFLFVWFDRCDTALWDAKQLQVGSVHGENNKTNDNRLHLILHQPWLSSAAFLGDSCTCESGTQCKSLTIGRACKQQVKGLCDLVSSQPCPVTCLCQYLLCFVLVAFRDFVWAFWE